MDGHPADSGSVYRSPWYGQPHFRKPGGGSADLLPPERVQSRVDRVDRPRRRRIGEAAHAWNPSAARSGIPSTRAKGLIAEVG